jgi:hypothetical protein
MFIFVIDRNRPHQAYEGTNSFILSGQHLSTNKILSELGFQANKNGLPVKNVRFFSNDTFKKMSINKNYLEFSIPYENRSTTGLWARNLLKFEDGLLLISLRLMQLMRIL